MARPTVQETTQADAPVPSLVAIVMEAPVAVALILGVLTRPLAWLLVLYAAGPGRYSLDARWFRPPSGTWSGGGSISRSKLYE